MKREEIIASLKENHEEFIEVISKMNADQFEFQRPEKWSVGQHLKHIILSIQPLRQGLILPIMVLQLVFGKSNRSSKSYSETIADYKKILAEGGKASAEFVPEKVLFKDRERMLKELDISLNKLIQSLESLKEEELDGLLVPHPLMGKITLRELLYFKIYHVGLHQEIFLRDLKLKGLNKTN